MEFELDVDFADDNNLITICKCTPPLYQPPTSKYIHLDTRSLFRVLEFATATDLLSLAATSTDLRLVANDEVLWKSLCRSLWTGNQNHPLERWVVFPSLDSDLDSTLASSSSESQSTSRSFRDSTPLPVPQMGSIRSALKDSQGSSSNSSSRGKSGSRSGEREKEKQRAARRESTPRRRSSIKSALARASRIVGLGHPRKSSSGSTSADKPGVSLAAPTAGLSSIFSASSSMTASTSSNAAVATSTGSTACTAGSKDDDLITVDVDLDILSTEASTDYFKKRQLTAKPVMAARRLPQRSTQAPFDPSSGSGSSSTSLASSRSTGSNVSDKPTALLPTSPTKVKARSLERPKEATLADGPRSPWKRGRSQPKTRVRSDFPTWFNQSFTDSKFQANISRYSSEGRQMRQALESSKVRADRGRQLQQQLQAELQQREQQAQSELSTSYWNLDSSTSTSASSRQQRGLSPVKEEESDVESEESWVLPTARRPCTLMPMPDPKGRANNFNNNNNSYSYSNRQQRSQPPFRRRPFLPAWVAEPGAEQVAPTSRARIQMEARSECIFDLAQITDSASLRNVDDPGWRVLSWRDSFYASKVDARRTAPYHCELRELGDFLMYTSGELAVCRFVAGGYGLIDDRIFVREPCSVRLSGAKMTLSGIASIGHWVRDPCDWGWRAWLLNGSLQLGSFDKTLGPWNYHGALRTARSGCRTIWPLASQWKDLPQHALLGSQNVADEMPGSLKHAYV